MGTFLALLTGLGGYALGTVQIVFLGSRSERRKHSRHLRAVASELRRVQTYLNKYDWQETGPDDDYVKAPPTVTSHFSEMILSTQWELTDEYLDDNLPDALFSVLDGVERLQHYSQQIRTWFDKLPAATSDHDRAELREEVLQYASEYDSTVAVLEEVVSSVLDDIDRRGPELRLRRRVVRAMQTLKPNPDPVKVLRPGDSDSRSEEST